MADPIHIAAPDGSIVEFPAGTSDAVMTAAMQKAYPPPAKADGGGILKTIDDYVRSAANGMTFGLADRFAAGMGALTGAGGNAGDYSGNLKSEQAKTDQFASEHPIGNIAAQTAGGLATFPVGGAATAIKEASLGGKALIGAGIGAGYGGLQGAGSSKDLTDLPQVAQNAAIGAGTGFATGGAVPILGAGIGAAGSGIANALQSVPGISRAAVPHLVSALQADTAPTVQAEITRLGPTAMLADAGPALLGKAQGTALNSDEARSTLATALKSRDVATNQRIAGDVNQALGPAEDPQIVRDAIIAHRQSVDNVAYPAALDNAPPVKTADILSQLDDMIPRSVGMEKKALTNLRGMMMTTEKRPVVDTAGYPQYDSAGQQRFQNVPVSQNDASVLHKVKQELDNVIQYDAPGLGVPAGAVSRQQGALKQFRGQLNDALETQVPGYQKANNASSALARRAEAVQAGTQYLGTGKTTPSPERFAGTFSQLAPGEQIALAKGSTGEIDRLLGTKLNDLQALKAALQGEGGWNAAKLGIVHGQDAADQLVGSVDRNLKFRDTYNKVVENSQTAQRQAAASAMKPEPSRQTPFFNPNANLSGQVTYAAKLAVSKLANALLQKDQTKGFGEVARVLSAQGSRRDAYHKALVEALNRRQANAATSAQVGNAAALAGGLAANDYVDNRLRSRSR